MVTTTKHKTDAQASAPAASAGVFIVTLCTLAAPVSIRPPQSPQLARFKFFMSRSRYVGGQERLHLHMGYFPTWAEAERCAQIMRARYPEATATELPSSVTSRSGGKTPTNPSQPVVEPPVLQGIQAEQAGTLTDTQVLQILQKRRVQPGDSSRPLQGRPEIALLRPQDTGTRRSLKEAVIQGTAVSFVIQLCQSERPIELHSLPNVDIFRAYTLYLVQGTHRDRPWYALRLGFFGDAISAKQVAHYARSSYTTVAVVPIAEAERVQGSQKPIALTRLAPALERNIDAILAADTARSQVEPTSQQPKADAPIGAPGKQNRVTKSPHSRSKDSLEQTLELLASSEIWSNPDSDSFSETGVRHLKVEVQRRTS